MKILMSNDDGYHALGINTLFDTLEESYQVTMVAPNQERSSCGHGITLGEPVRIVQHHENVFACSGFPADCVLIGIGHLFQDKRPDLVVSGINHGANLGQDRFYSGTMAAAREAAFRGVPSIAVSLVTLSGDKDEHFKTAADFVKKCIDKGIKELIPPMCMVNINSPNLPSEKISGVKLTKVGFQQYSEEVVERVDTRGRNYYWVGGTYGGHKDIPGSDCNAVFDGFMSVTLLFLTDNYDQEAVNKLEEFLHSL
ncbi:MAG: 5'/3'-nucleotidase SurE [Bdellovibrionota bacterium]|nr:5'/3'-nucleotidase SurE [Bdellovibrionota bacterium]